MGRIILAVMALGLLSGCYYDAPPPAYPYGYYYAAPGYYAPYPAYYYGPPAYGSVFTHGRWR